MKRILSIVLSSLLLVLSVPSIPVKSAPLYMTGDQAYEIYLSILSLIETGRLLNGSDTSIFTDSFNDFQSNIAEINSYLSAHSSELDGIDFYWSDGSSALKEDWVDEDWDLDGDGTADAAGSLANKLTLLTQDKIDELEDFNSSGNSNNFNENDNNPFSLLRKVAIGAGVLSASTFALIKGFWGSKLHDTTYFPDGSGIGVPGGMLTWSNYYNSTFEWIVNYNGKTSNYGVFDNRYGYMPVILYNNGSAISLRVKENGSYSSNSEPWNGKPISSTSVLMFNDYAGLSAFLRGDTSGVLNYVYSSFDYDILNQNMNNSFLPLIDTDFRPYGFIGLNTGLSTGLNNLGLSEDPSANSDLWLLDIPGIIDDILPDYPPYPIPQPIPDPIPQPIPDPEPDPQPEPDPDPDIGDPIIDDEGDLTEIPIIEGLQGRFPFSIPWDIKHLISNLSADREAPSFEYDFYISPRWLPPEGFLYHFDIDLSGFDYLASLFRRLFLLSFIIGLAVYSYAKFFGGGE